MNRFHLAPESPKSNVPVIVELPQLLDNSYYDYDADNESDDLSDLGNVEGNTAISLKQPGFYLKQFVKWTGQPKDSMFT